MSNNRNGIPIRLLVGPKGTPSFITDDNELVVATLNSSGTPSGIATETTLAAIETILNGATRTAGIERNTNTTGTVAAGAYNVSFFNAGSDDCTVATVTLKTGEVVTFDAGGEGNTLGAIAWTANTSASSEILITKVT